MAVQANEAVYTYGGTDSINSLIVGREITGLRAFPSIGWVRASISDGGFGATA